MIPQDPETRAAWATYEFLNAAANAEYRHRDAQMQAADEQRTAPAATRHGGDGMNWWKFGMLAWFAISVLLMVSTIGKPRKPLEPHAAAFALIIYAVLAFCVVRA